MKTGPVNINLRATLFSLSLGFSVAGAAQPASDNEMVISAIQSNTRVSDQNTIDAIVSEAKEEIRQRALDDKASNDVYGVTAVFSEGKSPGEVEEIIQTHSLETARVESKIAVGDSGNVYTMSTGMRDLLMADGSLAERIKQRVGSLRLRLLMQAQATDDTDLANAALDPEINIYQVDLIGDLRSIQDLNESPEIAALFLDTKSILVPAFEEAKRQNAQFGISRGETTTIYRPLEEGLPPGISPSQIFLNGPFPAPDNIPELLKK